MDIVGGLKSLIPSSIKNDVSGGLFPYHAKGMIDGTTFKGLLGMVEPKIRAVLPTQNSLGEPMPGDPEGQGWLSG